MNATVNRLGLAGLILWGIVGCSPAHTTSQAAGDAQSAVLLNGSESHIWVKAIDGKTIDISARGTNRLSPGRHRVRLQYSWNHGFVVWTGNEMAEYTFDVKPGARLQIRSENTEEPRRAQDPEYVGTWKVWIEDTASRTIVAPEGGQPVPVWGATGENTQPSMLPEISD